LPKYAISVEQLEKTTGINFMPQLPSNFAAMEKSFSLSDWSGLK
jgi:hypothetical protein